MQFIFVNCARCHQVLEGPSIRKEICSIDREMYCRFCFEKLMDEKKTPPSAIENAAKDLLANCNPKYAMYGPGRRLAQMVLGLPVEKDE